MTNRSLTIGGATLALALLTACGASAGSSGSSVSTGSSGSNGSDAGGTVKIGVVLPFTGVQAAVAKLEGLGAQVAAKEINDAGGINRKWKIELVNADDQLDPARSATVMRDLNDKKVALAVGGQTSDLCKSSAEASQRFNMTFIGAHCTSPTLVHPPITPNFFMTGQQIGEIGKALGMGITKHYPDVQTWDVLTYDVDAMKSSWDATKAQIEAGTGKTVTVGQKYAVPVGGTTMRNEINGLVSTPDKAKRGLFLGIYGAGTTSFIQQAKPSGLLDQYQVVVQAGVYWPTAVALDGKAPAIYNAHDYYYPCQDNAMNTAFVKEFEAQAGQKPDTGAMQGYLAVKTLEAAITKAGSIDTADVQKALLGLQVDTPWGLKMTIDASTHAGLGAVTSALLKGDPSAPQGVSISECDVHPVQK